MKGGGGRTQNSCGVIRSTMRKWRNVVEKQFAGRVKLMEPVWRAVSGEDSGALGEGNTAQALGNHEQRLGRNTAEGWETLQGRWRGNRRA